MINHTNKKIFDEHMSDAILESKNAVGFLKHSQYKALKRNVVLLWFYITILLVVQLLFNGNILAAYFIFPALIFLRMTAHIINIHAAKDIFKQ